MVERIIFERSARSGVDEMMEQIEVTMIAICVTEFFQDYIWNILSSLECNRFSDRDIKKIIFELYKLQY